MPAQPPFTIVPLHTVQERIANCILSTTAVDPTLGAITLLPHQRQAAALLRRALDRFGGALLADEVGLGKTYTALGVARHASRRLVVAPAALRDMWYAALARAGISAEFASYEQLSAGHSPANAPFDFVILDEAHHARNRTTHRYRSLAELTWGARVLLVSATPLHNAPSDLHALLALFLGTNAAVTNDGLLSALVVRRRVRDVPLAALPVLRTLTWHRITEAPNVAAAIAQLPPPLPPADGGTATPLLTLSLMRAWCSSDSALDAALRRRLETAVALEHALTNGEYPSRRDLAAWTSADGAVQLAFPALVTVSAQPAMVELLLPTVRAHAEAVRALRSLVAGSCARDIERFVTLRSIVMRHAGDLVLVFTHSTHTAHAAWRALRAGARVALLTAAGGRIASGALPRREVLAAFTTTAPGAPSPMAIDVLVATDMLSEGLNLQAANVVIHLDLPWTTSRLAQRIGRARRLGSSHREVVQHAIAPPADGSELAHTIGHLARKAGLVRRHVGRQDGIDDAVLPVVLGGGHASIGDAPPDAAEGLRQLAAQWSECASRSALAVESRDCGIAPSPAASVPTPAGGLQVGVAPSACLPWEWSPNTAGVESSAPPTACLVATARRLQFRKDSDIGLLTDWPDGRGEGAVIALIASDNELRLVAGDPASPRDDAGSVLQLAQSLQTCAGACHDQTIDSAMRHLMSWCAARDAEGDALAAFAVNTLAHRALSRRLSGTLAAAPRHLRPTVSRLVATARTLLQQSVGAGAEATLRRLEASAPRSAEGARDILDWLTTLADILAPRTRAEARHVTRLSAQPIAVIVVLPDGDRALRPEVPAS